jgi:hypothetical protein
MKKSYAPEIIAMIASLISAWFFAARYGLTIGFLLMIVLLVISFVRLQRKIKNNRTR